MPDRSPDRAFLNHELTSPDNDSSDNPSNDTPAVEQPVTHPESVDRVRPERLFPLVTQVRPIFPGVTVPVTFEFPDATEAVRQIVDRDGGYCLVVLAREGTAHDSAPASRMHEVGCLMRIHRAMPLKDNVIQVLGQAIVRVELTSPRAPDEHKRLPVRYRERAEPRPSPDLRAYMMAIASEVKQIISLNSHFKEQVNLIINQLNYESPGRTLDMLANLLSASKDVLQELLATFDVLERAKRVLELAKQEVEVARIQQSIQEQISEKVNHQQREYFLREQLKLIRRELGMDADAPESEAEALRQQLEAHELPEEVRRVVTQELRKLESLSAQSPEYNIARSYLQLIAELPWGTYSEDSDSIREARAILDRDHYGLADVKDAILELMSTIIRRGRVTGSIVLLVGPPGVGKTSIGKSVAEALGRKFYRFSVGGMRDEAEIKGHRRTYIGAMPGKLIQALRRVDTANPVIMLDEIDKLVANAHGDPASALLEVLDPAQNDAFVDHYLDVPFDISNVLFIATANTSDTIPRPLLDRMEVIRLSGYTQEEKLEIARRYLVGNQLDELGFDKSEVKFSRAGLLEIVNSYAREAGVRNLEKAIRKILRKVSLRLAEHPDTELPVLVDAGDVARYLGRATFSTEELYNDRVPGVALGLAYTTQGGATLYIEATGVRNERGGFRYTGQLGDVMKESADIAYTYIRGLLADAGNDYFDRHQVHLHVPAGATPKDGPSAGITMALALYSLATKTAVKTKLAMTGELTLTGKVLPIGGVREKTISARRVRIRKLVFPKANEPDFEELPEHLRKGISVHYADYFADVLEVAFGRSKKA